MKAIRSKAAPQAIGPYSQAIQSGNLLFISGQIPLDPVTQTVVGDTVEVQTERVLRNIQGLLQDLKLDTECIVKTTVYLKNMKDFGRFNEVYSKWFKEPCPARSTVEVSELPKGVLVEIESIAEVQR